MAYVFAIGAPTGPTGMTGMDGRQGALGWTGPVGPTGLTGWGGWGNIGPIGNSDFNLSAVTSGTSITVTTASLGTTYYITSPTISGITLPASMTGITAGAFWVFNNRCASALYIRLTNGTSTYNVPTVTSDIIIPANSSVTLVYDGSTVNYIVF
jgi:hypothetical protein